MNQTNRPTVDWEVSKRDFEPDGSLRDLYVLGTSLDDWNKFLAFVRGGPYRAEFSQDEKKSPIPERVDELFPAKATLVLWVGPIDLACHFFTADEIELDFYPNRVGEAELGALLSFMADLGGLTDKVVLLTPENSQENPIYRYSPASRAVEWLSPRAG